MGACLYEPTNIYKPLAPDVGVVDGPFEYLTVGGIRLPLPFTTRMTVVRLSNGDLFLHSPIKFDERLAMELQGLGKGFSRNDHLGVTACTPTSTGPACGCRLHERLERHRARTMAQRNRPSAFSRGLFQGVRFLPQNFEHADTHRHNHQPRIGQDFRALANGGQAHQDVSSLRRNILRHAVAAAFPAPKGEGGDRKD